MKQKTIIIAALVLQTILMIVLAAQIHSVAQKVDMIGGSGIKKGSAGGGIPMGMSAEGDHMKGDENAPVTIIEYSDFECYYCGKFYQETLPQIEDAYLKTGKAKLIYRNFPLGMHEHAQEAAEAAECAGAQDMFWEYHNKLFENPQSFNTANFKRWAGELGLDAEAFNTCLDTGEMKDTVLADYKEGINDGVQGTPGFLIDGKPISGAQPFSVFQQMIDSALTNTE